MIERLNLGSDYRLVVISDIHGGYNHLIKLLDKVNLTDNDFLIIIGDFLEKGPNSKEVLDFLIDLNKREKTYILKGNNEDFILKCIYNDNFSEILIKYMKYKEYGSLLDSYIKELNMDINIDTGKSIQKAIKKEFAKHLTFLNNLYTAIETQDFIFVHAGIEKIANWKKSKEHQLLYLESFLKKGHNTDKTVVVGHWPCSNYRKDSLSNEILFDSDNKIISLDGGFGVKDEGQINALIIHSINGKITYEEHFEDLLPIYKLKEDSEYFEGNTIKIGWPHNEIEIIEDGVSFSICKVLATNQITKVKNELIKKRDNKLYCIQDYIYKFYRGKKGEKVKLVKLFKDFSLIKVNNNFFWIKTSTLNIPD